MQGHIPLPLKDIFLNPKSEGTFSDTAEGVIKENPQTFVIDYIDLSNGINVYYKDVPHPRKGFPFPEAVAEINKVKRMCMDLVALTARNPLLAVTILFNLDKSLSLFNRACNALITPFIVKPELMSPFASEFQGLIGATLIELGISTNHSIDFARIIGTIFEYDNAYRFRLQDLFTETTKDKLTKSPLKESYRLYKIFLKREQQPQVLGKFARFIKILFPILLIPKVRRAVRKALRYAQFNRLQYDEHDIYWCRLRTDQDYLYFGQTYKERMKGYEFPLSVKIQL